MDSIILCYAPEDRAFAGALAEYLEANLPVTVSCTESIVRPGLDLVEATDIALSAEAALVLLSPASVPKTWQRKSWEPVFFERPKEFQTMLGFVLLRDCTFPALLRRACFFDACGDSLAAFREIRTWLLQPRKAPAAISPAAREFDDLRQLVADRPGTAAAVPIERAAAFALACRADFEAIYRFDCHGRSQAGVAGDIGSALGLVMSGRLEENRGLLSDWCAGHRVLFVLAGVQEADRAFVAPGGRSSVIFTAPDTDRLPGAIPSGAAAAVGKFEAALQESAEDRLRLGWIAVNLLKTLGRFAEVAEVLDSMVPIARRTAETGAVLRIQREQFWIHHHLGQEDREIAHWPRALPEEQLVLPFAG